MEQISFLAFDLGATSGRSILGTLRDGKLQMKELTRFPNQILELGGHYYWNIFSLYEHLKAGMIACAKEGAKITSIDLFPFCLAGFCHLGFAWRPFAVCILANLRDLLFVIPYCLSRAL